MYPFVWTLFPLTLPPLAVEFDWLTLLSIVGIPTLVSSVFAFLSNSRNLKATRGLNDSEVNSNTANALGGVIDRLTGENSRLDKLNRDLLTKMATYDSKFNEYDLKLSEQSQQIKNMEAKAEERKKKTIQLLEANHIDIPDWFKE